MKRLTLSFDNGPTEGTTAVLDALAARSIKTSFFLVGKQLRAPGARALAERAKAEGHWIGNHTLSHDVPLGMADAPHGHHVREIEEMDVLLGSLNENVPLFRPYAGKGILGPHVFTAEALDYLRRTRHTVVLWNSVPRDWEQPSSAWVARALADIEAQDWTTVVLHDKPNDAMKHLPDFLDAVLARGVEIRQDFPPDCLPVVAGEPRWDTSALVRNI
ncbi:polysaccharide deacetylase family protein [Variovorax beijingensis]|uniref:Polysaccharide deacetylase family protein n=1 Tax=Variovorax beijingensis TaxID=2496117 RepID=A0A3P3EVU7_9BURK|nr:polysaccharide deacetylase family protein [Variovorax beijingensis]RRH90381.1 polysaccharide deacetylase family protein [Variovorax beijingensis]